MKNVLQTMQMRKCMPIAKGKNTLRCSLLKEHYSVIKRTRLWMYVTA